jgi:hypothetical protein
VSGEDGGRRARLRQQGGRAHALATAGASVAAASGSLHPASCPAIWQERPPDASTRRRPSTRTLQRTGAESTAWTLNAYIDNYIQGRPCCSRRPSLPDRTPTIRSAPAPERTPGRCLFGVFQVPGAARSPSPSIIPRQTEFLSPPDPNLHAKRRGTKQAQSHVGVSQCNWKCAHVCQRIVQEAMREVARRRIYPPAS